METGTDWLNRTNDIPCLGQCNHSFFVLMPAEKAFFHVFEGVVHKILEALEQHPVPETDSTVGTSGETCFPQKLFFRGDDCVGNSISLEGK